MCNVNQKHFDGLSSDDKYELTKGTTVVSYSRPTSGRAIFSRCTKVWSR